MLKEKSKTKQQKSLTIQLIETNKEILAKNGDLKNPEIGSSNKNKIGPSKIRKENFTY